MIKRFVSICLCLSLLLLALPASAAMQSGTDVQLVVCGDLVPLDDSTGYISRNGSRLYIPLETVATALGYAVQSDDDGTVITVAAPGGNVAAASGYRSIYVNDAKKQLKAKAAMYRGRLMVDYHILEYLDADVALYKLTDEMKLLGYTGPVMVISRKGESTAAPSLTGDSLAASLEAAKLTDQIVAVQYTEGSSATLTYHEKVDGVWRQVLSCDAIVGANGIGKSVEGDKKTPRGTYDLTQAFGIQADPGTALPYTQVTKYDYWCCTSDSPYYNQLVNIKETDYTPTSDDEQLKSAKGYYDYGIVINYNADCVPGKGSAIFLHCSGSKESTSGCIAIPEKVLKQLLQALRPGAKIVIF
ncbi:MAG: L,D-transpeptidase family protein [Clostridia bacterium]|nr:L,D-transpeptidase family protein [Clostridia bacterium]